MRKPKSSTFEEDNPLLFSARSRKNIALASPRGRNEEIDRIIDYSKASAHQSLKRQMNSFFEDSTIDFGLKTINGILSLVLVVEYMYAMYSPDTFMSLSWGLGSFLIHLYLICEYICRIYSAKDSRKYFFSLESRIDLISNVPFFIFRFVTQNPLYDDPNNLLLNIGNAMSILRLMRLESYQRFIENEVNRQLTNITLTILTLILFASACLQLIQTLNAEYLDKSELEKQKANYPYQFYIFSIIIAISTLGYENNFPGAITKVFLIFLIIVSLFIIPTKSSQLISIFSSKSVYARMKYKTTEQVKHIIVTGAVSNASAYDFFNEFFHEDHGGQSRHGVLLLPHPPDSQMESMIRDKDFGNNIFYIQGDPLKEADLRRCQAEKAKAIIILCNKQSSDANEEDATTILQAMFIKKYLKHAKAPHVKVCMQILRPEGKTHYYLSLNKQTKSDQVLCVEELKLSLLAKSCLCPGLMALVSNLISSSGEPPKRTETDNEWLEDYWHGKGYEVYKVFLSSEFHGQKFSWVAAKIYKKFRAILFALELGHDETARMYNNPGDYILPRGHRLTAYVISEDMEIADAISDYKLKQEDINLTKKLLRKSSSFIKRASAKALTLTHIFEKHDATVDDKSDDAENEDEDPVQFPTKVKQENFNQNLTGEFISLEDGFHLSPSKTSLIDVSFKTMENNILATNHIILCGLVSNLRNFVLPLRAKYLDKFPPIVILHVSPPTEKQWNQISFFPEIYFVKGSAMIMKDLQRANIRHASRIVVLSPEIEEVRHFVSANEAAIGSKKKDPKAGSKRLTRDQEDLLDAKTIFKYKAITKLRPDLQIITELVSPQNLGFLIGDAKDYATMKKYGQVNTPTFASGSIYLSSMIDNLICQAYYNPSLNTVLNQLIVGSGGAKQRNPHVTNEIQGSNLYHFPLPKAFVNQTFESAFEYLSKYQNIIPLALYRQSGVKGNKIPYVVTNPDPETVLTDKDMLFILSQKSPPASSAEWGAPFEFRENDERTERSIMTARTVLHNQEVAINYEEVGKENLRHKKLNMESELAVSKIREMVVDLKKAREEIETLKGDLEQRQKKILVAIRKTISTQIGSMLPADTSDRKIVYDDDDMLTASPASSISQ